MKYVLDSSVALKWVLPEADSAKAIRLRDGYSNGVHKLLAPDARRGRAIFPLPFPASPKRKRRGLSALTEGQDLT
jgi:hypothetical protein